MTTSGISGDGTESSISTKPYLIRAIYDWALDNGFTPQILVDTDQKDVDVPRQYIKDNQIILNIHPKAVVGLDLGNDNVWCSARFAGKECEMTVPVIAVLAIYARENGQGIVFQDDNGGIAPPNGPSDNPESEPPKPDSKGAGPSHLKLVKK